jgi:starch synthase (maltosyl-transferring)
MAKRQRVDSSGALDSRLRQRVVIEAIEPAVDGGRVPIKRTPGEQVEVSADVFADGHDMIAVLLLHREQGARAWRETPMVDAKNDRWTASFPIERLTGYEYTVEGWVDRFAT